MSGPKRFMAGSLPGSMTMSDGNARKSLDGTLWICNDPQYAPYGIKPIQKLSYADAVALMATPEWAAEEV